MSDKLWETETRKTVKSNNTEQTPSRFVSFKTNSFYQSCASEKKGPTPQTTGFSQRMDMERRNKQNLHISFTRDAVTQTDTPGPTAHLHFYTYLW